MPLFVHYTRLGLVVWLMVVATAIEYAAYRDKSWGFALFGSVYIVAAVGLFRGVIWGRQLTSIGQVLVAFTASSAFLGDVDEPGGATLLTHLLGSSTPIWIDSAAMILVGTLLLVPLVIVGWRTSYFRGEKW
jgi:hypothetical protein